MPENDSDTVAFIKPGCTGYYENGEYGKSLFSRKTAIAGCFSDGTICTPLSPAERRGNAPCVRLFTVVLPCSCGAYGSRRRCVLAIVTGVSKRRKSYERQEVVDLEYEGRGIIKPGGVVVFVDDVLPGEIVDVHVYRWKKSFGYARVTHRHTDSPDRIAPFCRHFEHCGGCKWQYLPYERQVAWKEAFIRQIYRSIASGVDLPDMEPLLAAPADRRYRNKLDFSFSSRRWLTPEEIAGGEVFDDRSALGFHVRGHFDKVLEIEECHLQPEPSNEIRNAVASFARAEGLCFFDPVANEGLLRSLIIRTTRDGQVMVIVVFGERNDDDADRVVGFLTDRFPAITSLYTTVNVSRNDAIAHCTMEHRGGTPHICENIDGLDLLIGPKSFFQTNPEQAERLYRLILDWAQLDGSQTVHDIYCGTGSISLLAARHARSVFGVESVEEAILGARENAVRNGIGNCTFVTGEAEKVLRDGFPGDAGRPDLVIVDPPRAGLHPRMVDTLLAERPPRIIYVSCKPSTQARDVERLSQAYRVTRMRGVDMFPQTFHIECVVELTRAE